MPEISRFFGKIIAMYYNDHGPAHYHVRYGQQKALFGIDKLNLLEGELSPKVLGMVKEWAALHQQELTEDWELAKKHAPLKKITPLE